MKILVTGGAGFIGSALIRFLIKNTDHTILNYDALSYSGNLSSLDTIQDSPKYSFVQGDICDEKKLQFTFSDFQPEGLIHLAAESHVDRSIDNSTPFINTNILGTFNLLNTSLTYWRSMPSRLKQDFLFHHVSTDEVYGDIPADEPPCDELKAYEPSSPYSASKAASDHLVSSWHRTYKFPAIITNCSNNYGPFHFPEKFIPHIILNSLHGKQIPIYGNGQQIRDWIYVDDHVQGLYLAFMNGTAGETYNIGASNEIKNIDIANAVCTLLDELVTNKPNRINSFSDLITFVKDRPGHDQRYAINSSKVKSQLGWKANETFESGLRKTVQWYLDNKDWWMAILERDYSLSRIGKSE